MTQDTAANCKSSAAKRWRMKPSTICALVSIAALLLFYHLKWNLNLWMSDSDRLACYGQICVGDEMVGSGFFLEDVDGLKRAHYFVTNEHVHRQALELSQKRDCPVYLRFKSGDSDKAACLVLGTSYFSQFANTDIVAIPIYSPFVNRIITDAGYRFMVLDRKLVSGEKIKIDKNRDYLISSSNYSTHGIAARTPTKTFHHIPEPGFGARVLNLWTNTVELSEGYLLSMPRLSAPFPGYHPLYLFQIISSVIPGDSGSPVMHEVDGVKYAFAVIEGMPIASGFRQAGPAWAIPTDYVIASINPPTWKSTRWGLQRAPILLIALFFVFKFAFALLFWLIRKSGKRGENG